MGFMCNRKDDIAFPCTGQNLEADLVNSALTAQTHTQYFLRDIFLVFKVFPCLTSNHISSVSDSLSYFGWYNYVILNLL